MSFSLSLLQPGRSISAGLFALLSSAVLAPGCTEEEKPEYLAASGGMGGLRGGAFSALGLNGSSSRDLKCDALLSEERDCGSETTLLTQQFPDFLFLLDSSGSMGDQISGGETRLEVSAAAIYETLDLVGHRMDYGVIHFPGNDTRFASSFLVDFGPGDSTSEICAEETPRLDQADEALAELLPAGSTPLGSALSEIYSFWESQGTSPDAGTQPRFLVVVTDGFPTDDGFCPGSGGDPVLCAPTQHAIYRAERLRELGVDTYVVGLPGFDQGDEFLRDLARAGGTDRAAPGGYFDAKDPSDIAEVLRDIAAETRSCDIVISSEVDNPDLINVYLDGGLVERDEDNGWFVVSENLLRLAGDACDTARDSDLGQVEVEYGCDNLFR